MIIQTTKTSNRPNRFWNNRVIFEYQPLNQDWPTSRIELVTQEINNCYSAWTELAPTWYLLGCFHGPLNTSNLGERDFFQVYASIQNYFNNNNCKWGLSWVAWHSHDAKATHARGKTTAA